MDHEQEAPDPWISVPDDLVVKIIARLPLPSLLRLRSLNTRFLHITSSNACLHRWALLRALNPWLLFWIWKFDSGLTHKAQCLVHDVVSQSWHELPVDTLPPSFGSFVLGSAGGLLLLRNKATPGFKYVKKLLIVCNLLTKSWIQVPTCSNIVFTEATGFIVDEKTKSYKIVVVGAAKEGEAGHDLFAMSSRGNLITEVYDSEGKAWRAGGACPEGLRLQMGAMISCDKRLYCWSDKTAGVVAYSVENDVWETIGMPESQDADRKCWLVRCAGMPMIVGSMKREGGGMMIWKLMEELGNKWMEVEAMAVEDSERLCGDSNGGCCIRQCVGVGGRIYILSSTPDVPSIVFDHPARRWSVLHPLPSELWGNSCKRTHVEATDLQPGFLASP